MKKIILILTGFVLFLSSCKSFRKTTYDHTQKIRLNKLLREADNHRFSSKTLEAGLAVSYNDDTQSFSGKGKIRILKDSIIWGSLNFLGIPMAKFYITPTKIQYYNKINRSYYDGSLDLLEQKLGLSFGFNDLQNLLTGDLISKINPEKTSLIINADNYELHLQNPVVKKISLTAFYKMLSGTFYDSSQGNIQLNYQNYQQIAKEYIPGSIVIQTGIKHLKIKYSKIFLNKALGFPFRIPDNYQKL